jgi:hypothetical protein
MIKQIEFRKVLRPKRGQRNAKKPEKNFRLRSYDRPKYLNPRKNILKYLFDLLAFFLEWRYFGRL